MNRAPEAAGVLATKGQTRGGIPPGWLHPATGQRLPLTIWTPLYANRSLGCELGETPQFLASSPCNRSRFYMGEPVRLESLTVPRKSGVKDRLRLAHKTDHPISRRAQSECAKGLESASHESWRSPGIISSQEHTITSTPLRPALGHLSEG